MEELHHFFLTVSLPTDIVIFLKRSVLEKRLLVLIPAAKSKFLAAPKTPFAILEKVDEVTYNVMQPGHETA